MTGFATIDAAIASLPRGSLMENNPFQQRTPSIVGNDRIRSTHPWLTMDTTGSTALSPANSPPTGISTHGEFNSPRGCRGTFGSVGTAEATRIDADFTGTDCQQARFTGRVVLTKGQ